MKDCGEERRQAQVLRQRLGERVGPLLCQLDEVLDKRLVATFFVTLQALLIHRHSRHGLLLSELGAFILSPSQAPAGTKRLSNLLRSRRWEAAVVADFLWQQAARAVQQLQQD
ncbi:MAG TPA: hypothetical protein VER79_07350, partial [Candidatus Limnocylindrales bacterium]|nr:hypothetical protein [Candidatus Limnocylindrales bacterium]